MALAEGQFSLRSIFWAIALVAAFLGGCLAFDRWMNAHHEAHVNAEYEQIKAEFDQKRSK
jgi:hypothetical protein